MSTPTEVATDLAAWARYTRDRVHQVVVMHGALLQTNVKRHANQPRTNPRPSANVEGPRLLTGDYNRSINRRTERRANTTRAEVGSSAPQAARLENGFNGVDSLGRNYSQQPYPHFAPGLEDTEPGFIADLEQVLAPPGIAGATGSTRGPTIA